jgi:acetyl esterase/lipase
MDNPPAAPLSRQLPTTEEAEIRLKPVRIGWRSRLIVWLLRHLLRPMLARMIRGTPERIARTQLFLAGRVCRNSYGLPLDYRVLGQAQGRVPGHFVGGKHDTGKRVLLYLHGGAFILPAVPDVHVRMVARMCRELDAVGFVPDYRLAPFNRFPAALDDCERAYRALLDLDYAPERIAIAGESAGGNLLLGVLQRIRKAGLPMPACAVPISPGTEMGRIHGPPSRTLRMKQDPILPMAALAYVGELYAGGLDTSDPELSPLYADCTGFPPLYLLASDNEVLLDDTVLFARQAVQAGVEARFEVWPALPHAFPLFAAWFPEVKQAQDDIIGFMRRYLK